MQYLTTVSIDLKKSQNINVVMVYRADYIRYCICVFSIHTAKVSNLVSYLTVFDTSSENRRFKSLDDKMPRFSHKFVIM